MRTRSGWHATVPCCWCAPRSVTGAGCGALLCRCGLPDHVLCLLGVTPSLRRSWLLSVIGVLAVVAGKPRRSGTAEIGAGAPGRVAGYRDPEVLAPFVLLAPLLCWRGWRRRSCRCSTLPVGWRSRRRSPVSPCCGPFGIRAGRRAWSRWSPPLPCCPGPGGCRSRCCCRRWRCARSRSRPRPSWTPGPLPFTAGVLWAVPVLLLATVHGPLPIVQANAQFACAACCFACAVVLLARHDRFEWGWMR